MGQDVTHHAATTLDITGAEPRLSRPERTLADLVEGVPQVNDAPHSRRSRRAGGAGVSMVRSDEARGPLGQALDGLDGEGAARPWMNGQARRALTPKGQPPLAAAATRASAAGPGRPEDCGTLVELAAGHRAAALTAISTLSQGLHRRDRDVAHLRYQIRTARQTPPEPRSSWTSWRISDAASQNTTSPRSWR